MAYEGRYRETVKGFGEGSQAGDQSLAEIIQSLDSDLVAFRGCVQSIGTQFDDVQNRNEIKRLRGVIKDKLTCADNELKSLRTSGQPSHKLIVDRQARQVEGQLNTFNDLIQMEKKATQRNPLGSGATSPYDDQTVQGDGISSITTQTQLGGMSALEVREREAQELLELERDIVDLHHIQTDIATLVNDQGTEIDQIEVRTEQAQVRVEQGAVNTERAVELKKKNLKLMLIIGGVVAGVVITILVVVVIVGAVFGTRATQ